MGRKTREKGSNPEKVDYSGLLRELQEENRRKKSYSKPKRKYRNYVNN